MECTFTLKYQLLSDENDMDAIMDRWRKQAVMMRWSESDSQVT